VNDKTEGQEKVGLVLRSVNLDTTKDGNLAIATNFTAPSGNNPVHHTLLGIIKSQRKLDSRFRRFGETGRMGEKELSNVRLLGIHSIVHLVTRGSSLSLVDRRNVTGSSGSTSTASAAHSMDSTTFDFSDNSVLVHTHVRTKAHQATSTGRNVMRHGTKTRDSTKGESSQATHVKVGRVEFGEILLEDTVHLVAAKRHGHETGLTVAVRGQSLTHTVNELSVRNGTGKDLGDMRSSLKIYNCMEAII
jgi:hypothetical protein